MFRTQLYFFAFAFGMLVSFSEILLGSIARQLKYTVPILTCTNKWLYMDVYED